MAYAVVALASLVSATFTVFYGLTFGASKSQKWIMTMMISFWQDVLISQPLKVFAAATFFALVIKNPDKVNNFSHRSVICRIDRLAIIGRVEQYKLV